MDRIVLAYSGGLHTSAAIPWLREKYAAEIIAVAMDLGQGRELEAVRDLALAAGARRAHVLDLREDFARDFVLPALKAGAIDEHQYPLVTELARAPIAQKLVEIAGMEQARAVAHGCAGDPAGQSPLDLAILALNPELTVIAPARDWRMTDSQLVEYARLRGIPVPPDSDHAPTVDVNVWGRSVRLGSALRETDDPYSMTRAPAECPDEPAYVDVRLECGVPTGINGVTLPLVELISSLNTIAGAHGVGRIGRVEPRAVGQSRRICEAPAAVVLHAAQREMLRRVASSELQRFARSVALQYIEIVRAGSWFTPLRAALDAFVESVQQRVTGSVRLKLFKGAHAVDSLSGERAARVSPAALTELDGLATRP
jgi:argininosuccinate synthase